MELNREQIIKGLECCTDKKYRCEDCPYFFKSEGIKSSMEILMTDALALIRELTESLDRVQKQCGEIIVECDERDAERLKQVAKLTEENERLSDLLTETEIPFEQALDRNKWLESKIKELADENERLIAESAKEFTCAFASPHKVADCPLPDEVAKAKADTVRKMQERLKSLCVVDQMAIPKEQALWVIDQIAKELLEEGENG